MTKNTIETVLSLLPLADGLPDFGKEGDGDRYAPHVVVSTTRGDVILFNRLEDVGFEGTDEATVGLFAGYELTLTLARRPTIDVWQVRRVGERLSISHTPGEIARDRVMMRHPYAPIVDVEYWRGDVS